MITINSAKKDDHFHPRSLSTRCTVVPPSLKKGQTIPQANSG